MAEKNSFDNVIPYKMSIGRDSEYQGKPVFIDRPDSVLPGVWHSDTDYKSNKVTDLDGIN